MSDLYSLDELRRSAADLHLSGYLSKIVQSAAPVATIEAVFDGSPQPLGSTWPEPGRYLLIRQKDNDE